MQRPRDELARHKRACVLAMLIEPQNIRTVFRARHDVMPFSRLRVTDVHGPSAWELHVSHRACCKVGR